MARAERIWEVTREPFLESPITVRDMLRLSRRTGVWPVTRVANDGAARLGKAGSNSTTPVGSSVRSGARQSAASTRIVATGYSGTGLTFGTLAALRQTLARETDTDPQTAAVAASYERLRGALERLKADPQNAEEV